MQDGTLIPDITCTCKLNKRGSDGELQFVVETQRSYQKSYIDRCILMGGRILDTRFIKKMSKKNAGGETPENKMFSGNHNSKFENNVIPVRQLCCIAIIKSNI